MRFCGVDVGYELLYPVVLDMRERRLAMPRLALRPAEAVEWVEERVPIAIAIDSPARPNRGLLAHARYRARHGIELKSGADRRVCEWRLGIGGCYSTRFCHGDCQPWMRTGMDLFAAFEELGFELDTGAGGSLFEIHPTYGFRSLVGIERHGLRVRCKKLAPKRPAGSLGHRQRLGLLAALLRRWRVRLDPRAATSLDWTDAILGAALAALRAEGGTLSVDAPSHDEGAIVLAAFPLAGAEAVLRCAGERCRPPAGPGRGGLREARRKRDRIARCAVAKPELQRG
jgi:hypothetical protein